MNFDLISAKPEAKAHTTLSATVTVDMAKQQYKVDDLKFNTVAQGKALPVQKANIDLSGNINADMVKKLVSVSDLKLTAQASNDKQKVDAQLSSQMQELLLKGNIKATKLLSGNPNYSGQINVEPFDLRKLVSNMGIELPKMADDSTLKNVALSTSLSGSSNSVDLQKLNVTLDQSKLTGQLAVNNFAKPAFNFKLNLDQIDADRYLPPVDKSKKEAAATPATSAAGGASNGDFAFTDGALKGINIAESIRKAKAALKGESLPASSETEQTDFSSLSGSFTAKNGLVDNQDLKLMSPLLRVNGAGTANLPTQKIDYGLKVSVVGSTEGQ
ncbi:hypothetical protein COL154_013879, partial [Colletotrichum chrysophilum]